MTTSASPSSPAAADHSALPPAVAELYRIMTGAPDASLGSPGRLADAVAVYYLLKTSQLRPYQDAGELPGHEELPFFVIRRRQGTEELRSRHRDMHRPCSDIIPGLRVDLARLVWLGNVSPYQVLWFLYQDEYLSPSDALTAAENDVVLTKALKPAEALFFEVESSVPPERRRSRP